MRVLVTNDDGVDAAGIHALARAVASTGHDTLVAAPMDDRSGSGAGVGAWHLGNGIDVEEVAIPGAAGVVAYAVDGPPALAVMAARLGAFGDAPDVVVSGVNPGPNTGRAVLHSGTVGAALTAANFGVSGLAVSVAVGDPVRYDTASAVAVLGLDWLIIQPPRTVLNINVPDLDLSALRGIREARLAPFGTVRAAVAESQDGRIQMELRATGVELEEDTDTALVNAGFVAVTSLVGIRSVGQTTAPRWMTDRLATAPAIGGDVMVTEA
jgi:5'-nucleotidase